MAEELIQGGDIFVYGADTRYFGHSKSSSIKMSAQAKSVSSKDIVGNFDISRPGKKSMTISVNGLQFVDATSTDKLDTDFVIDTFLAGTIIPVKYKPKTTSRKYVSAKMWISELSLEDPEDENSTWSMTLSLSEAPTYAASV